MGFFYRAAGGGASNDPTYPSTPITFGGTESTKTFTLTNSGDTPASVELSFSSLSGGQTLLIGQNYDQGTDTSPTYVIDPDTGTRTVTLARGALSPSSPSSSEIVTLTSNAGVLPQTITCTVEPQPYVDAVIRGIATPTYEFKFDGNFDNTGSAGGTSTPYQMTATSDTVTYPGARGYGRGASAYYYHRINANHSDTLRNTNRSWINILRIVTGRGQTYFTRYHETTAESGPGWIESAYGLYRLKYTNTGSSDVLLDTSHSHTDGGASEDCYHANNKTIALCASYDASASTTTFRWKSTGGRAGHSYAVINSVTGSTSSGSSQCYFGGSSSSPYYEVDWLNQSIINALVTEQDFNNILNVMGL